MEALLGGIHGFKPGFGISLIHQAAAVRNWGTVTIENASPKTLRTVYDTLLLL
jgi:hypothetical protein